MVTEPRAVVALVAAASMAVLAGPAPAAAGALYDMDRFLNQPHPFAGAPPERPPPAPPPPQSRPPLPVAGAAAKPAPAPPPPPPPPNPAPAAGPSAGGGAWGWISEVRAGVLKHSAPITTSTPKETGVDANLEVLFVSPAWLDLVWSPRPHLGASFNASDANTDQVYAGLTWEWMPFDSLFIDFSFGFAGHNGRLENEPGDTDTGRRREFGCSVLFRESLEVGYVFLRRHSLSVIWDHISHGGLCDDENEGMDNLGARYGYRF